jgi:hypothetical protein
MVMAENIGGSLQQIILPYPDFQLGQIIDPYEHNANNAEMLQKINQMVTVLNSFINGEANTSLSAMAVHMPAVEPIASSDVETFLRTLVGLLRSVEISSSGAHFVKSAPIQGVPGDTIWEQLSFISEAITGVDSETGDPILSEGGQEISLAGQLQSLITAFASHKSGADHDSRYYTKDQIDDLLTGGGEEGGSGFLEKDGNFEGTWNGWTVEEIRSFSGTGFGQIEVLSADPINPAVGRIWIVSGQGGE